MASNKDTSHEHADTQNTWADLNALKFQSFVCGHGNQYLSQYSNISFFSFTVFSLFQVKMDEGLEFVTYLNAHKHLCTGE